MKPAANTGSYSQPLTPPNTSHQMFKHNEPKQEPDLNRNHVDPDYIYAIPEGSCGEVKLPVGLKSPPGKKQTSFSFLNLFFFSYSAYVQLVLRSQTVSSHSPWSPSKTHIFGIDARIRAGVTLDPSVILILSVISFTHTNCLIIYLWRYCSMCII